MLEREIENQILDWLFIQPWCFAWKAKDKASFMDGRRLKPGRHNIRGVSDIILMREGGYVDFIEVKTKTGKQSDHQKSFEAKVKKFGGNYFVVRSLKEIIDIYQEMS